MKEKKGIVITVIALILILVIVGGLIYGYLKKATLEVKNPIVTMEVQDYGTIKIELYPDKAPDTVANFVKLANNGFYDGTTFHRVIEDFMIQGGSANDDGTGEVQLSDLYTDINGNIDVEAYCELTGSTKKEYEELKSKIESNNIENEESEGAEDTDTENSTENTTTEDSTAEYINKEYVITGEFMANNYKENDLNLTEGVIAMARKNYGNSTSTLLSAGYNSGGSEFFIMTTNDNTSITGYYTGFGKVIEGMDVIKKIAAVEVEPADEENGETEASTPKTEVKVTSVRVETYGVEYGLPTILEPFDYMTWLYSQYGLTYAE